MPWPGKAYTVLGAASCAVADITRSVPTFAVTSMISAPRSMPTRSTRKSISSPGMTMPRKRDVQPTRRAGGVARPSVAVTTCCAAADSHMPCTMGDFRPASSAAARSVWIGLWSPETTANALMSVGAVTMTSRRRRRGVSVALSVIAPPACGGSVSATAPVRPRIANRSSSVASSVPSASRMVTDTGTTRPTSVSTAAEAVAVTVNSALAFGIGASRCAAWSRCTRLSRPSTTGKPVSVTAEPMTANTAGQQRPTSASGTSVRPGASGRAERGGDAGVVGDLLGIPGHGDRRAVVDDGRQRVGPVDSGGDRQHGAHGGRGVLGGDDGHAAVDRASRAA